MRLRNLFFPLILILAVHSARAQSDPLWDDTQSKSWPAQAQRISIPSSVDNKLQPAYFYKAPGKQPRPLVVSLHTWSGDFQQKDTLIYFCIERDYHYIRPNFRGPNHTQEALGSPLVVSDIDDAIDYSLSHASVDPDNIHVIGVSGGGHATLMTYMKSKHAIRSFSAYVGIYNLIDWYHESLGRGNKYAGDIAAATSGSRKQPDEQEARRRSPFFLQTPVEKRAKAKLNLYCGIHDGYTGSVPISQTLHLYNKIVRDFHSNALTSLVPEQFISTMVSSRSFPDVSPRDKFLGRQVIYRNHYKDLIDLIVFEGGHEMPAGDVLAHVPSRTILAIGDSNGAMKDGWADQLAKLRPHDRIINTCRSGNTIGFDNLDRQELNTLRNIDYYLGMAEGRVHAIVIMLGTNDCKTVFDGQFNEVGSNLDKLIKRIREVVANTPEIGTPDIYITSPPPYGNDDILEPKYHGAARKVEILAKEFGEVAKNNQTTYIETHGKLKSVFPYISYDGVHLSPEGQTILAGILNEKLDSDD